MPKAEFSADIREAVMLQANLSQQALFFANGSVFRYFSQKIYFVSTTSS